MLRDGKIKERTVFDLNKIHILDNHAIIDLYDSKNNINGESYIDLEDIESIKQYMDDIVTSREFGLESAKPKEISKSGLKWNQETERIFDDLIQLSPPQFQQMAKMAISSLAEEKANKRTSLIVENQDITNAFLEGTPGAFQADMKEGLKKYRLLDE
ncbi:MAG: hypothetical protein KGD68_03960, partial [Candidatus Lokiarchaeota archaeon]|nr:hypothetical protein [Candidatus Lokiarchaeota archaeon]